MGDFREAGEEESGGGGGDAEKRRTSLVKDNSHRRSQMSLFHGFCVSSAMCLCHFILTINSLGGTMLFSSF